MTSDITSIPTWLWTGLGALLLLAVGGLGTWVGTTLNDHSSRLSATEARIVIMEKQQDRLEDKLDRILEAVRK